MSLADEPLSSGAVNTNHLFWGVPTIQEGGKLSVNSSSTKMQEAISRISQLCTLVQKPNHYIGGTAAGTTQLEIQGSPAKDQGYTMLQTI